MDTGTIYILCGKITSGIFCTSSSANIIRSNSIIKDDTKEDSLGLFLSVRKDFTVFGCATSVLGVLELHVDTDRNFSRGLMLEFL